MKASSNMKLQVKTLTNKSAGELAMPAAVFGCEVREDIMSREMENRN